MLLPPEIVLDAIRRRRCVRTGAILSSEERIVCQSAFPSLYAGRSDREEARYVETIFRSFIDVIALSDRDPEVRELVRHFVAFFVAKKAMLKESHVHFYLFEFWEELCAVESDITPFSERYFEGVARGSNSNFARNLLPRLSSAEDAYPDIVGLGGRAGRDLIVVEVKLGELDDRGVGQIQRYYSIARSACDRLWHDCDISRVIPVVVVSSARLPFWEALPLHFREFLQIYFYSVDSDLNLRLTDGRRVLQTQARERLLRAG